jgi:hypothetical protein
MKKKRWDDQIRGFQTIDHIHVQPGEGRRRWDGMIRSEVFK